MPTPNDLRGPTRATSISDRPADWTCAQCRRLLGVVRGDRLHIRFARSHEYHTGFPVTCTCRGCGTLNHRAAPSTLR